MTNKEKKQVILLALFISFIVTIAVLVKEREKDYPETKKTIAICTESDSWKKRPRMHYSYQIENKIYTGFRDRSYQGIVLKIGDTLVMKYFVAFPENHTLIGLRPLINAPSN